MGIHERTYSAYRPYAALCFFVFGCFLFAHALGALKTQRGSRWPDLTSKSTVELIVLLEGGTAVERAAAADELGARGPEAASAVPLLIQAVNGPDHTLALEAVRTLRALGLPYAEEAAPALYAALHHDDYAVGRAASFAVISLFGESALPELTTHFRAGNERAKAVIAQGLAKLGRPAQRMLPELLEGARSSDTTLRLMAVEALGAARAEQAVPELLPHLYNGGVRNTGEEFRMGQIRSAAAKALGQIGAAAAPAAPRLLEMLFHDQEAQRGAAEGLGGIGKAAESEIVPPLAAFVRQGSGWTHALAAYVLRNAGSEPARIAWQEYAQREAPRQLAVLQDKSRRDRLIAAEMLGYIGEPSTLGSLIAALHDQDADVRALAATALGYFGSVEAVPYLIEAMNSADFQHCGNAGHALAYFDTPEAEEARGYYLRYEEN